MIAFFAYRFIFQQLTVVKMEPHPGDIVPYSRRDRRTRYDGERANEAVVFFPSSEVVVVIHLTKSEDSICRPSAPVANVDQEAAIVFGESDAIFPLKQLYFEVG